MGLRKIKELMQVAMVSIGIREGSDMAKLELRKNQSEARKDAAQVWFKRKKFFYMTYSCHIQHVKLVSNNIPRTLTMRNLQGQ